MNEVPEYPAAWRSVDGRAWTPIALSPEEDAAAWGYLSTVVSYDGGLVAAGASDGPGGPGPVAVGTIDSHHLDDPAWSPAAVWTSPDGATWDRVAHEDEVSVTATAPPCPTSPPPGWG